MVRKVSRTSAVCVAQGGGQRQRLSRTCARLPGGDLGDGGGVDAGVLADVERLQVQAVGADLHQQRVDEHLGEAMAAVFVQRVAEGGEIAEEIGGAGVGRERGVRRERERRTAASPPRRIMMQAMSRRTDSCGKRSSRAFWPAVRSCVR